MCIRDRGYTAASLIANGKTGYMSSVRNTTAPADQWIAGGVPITMIEQAHGVEGDEGQAAAQEHQRNQKDHADAGVESRKKERDLLSTLLYLPVQSIGNMGNFNIDVF